MYDDDDEEDGYQAPRQWRCWLHSAPGMWERYDGYVDVRVAREDQVFAEAVRVLARTSFPDRPSLSSWKLDRIELLK